MTTMPKLQNYERRIDMADCSTLAHPSAWHCVSLELGSGSLLSFDIDTGPTACREGQDLIFNFNNTLELTLEGFFESADNKPDPCAPLTKQQKFHERAVPSCVPLRDFLFKDDDEIFF